MKDFLTRHRFALMACGAVSVIIGATGLWWNGGTFIHQFILFSGLVYGALPAALVAALCTFFGTRHEIFRRLSAGCVYICLFAVIQAAFLPLSDMQGRAKIDRAKAFCVEIDGIIEAEIRRAGKSPQNADEIDLLVRDLEKPAIPTFHRFADGEFTCVIPLPNRLSGALTYSGRTKKWHGNEYSTSTPSRVKP